VSATERDRRRRSAGYGTERSAALPASEAKTQRDRRRRSAGYGTERSAALPASEARTRQRPVRRASDRSRRERPEQANSTARGRRSQSARARTGTRPSRRKALRRRWIALLTVLTVAAVVYFLFFTSMLGVRSVEVIGNSAVSTEKLLAAADIPEQKPMMALDTGVIQERVGALPGIATVEVSRSWPSTVEIEVIERTPIGYYDTGEKLHLVDGNGVVYKEITEKPAGLPELKLPRVAPDDPVTRAVTAVLAAIPKELRDRVVAAGAETAGSVTLTLADGKTVRWGDAEQSDRKAKVLAALMTREGTTYDISSPELPTVS
jgi:cell division protein FtsQ